MKPYEEVPALTLFRGGESRDFCFDAVLGPLASHDMVFSEVEGLVNSALDGHKACVFLYGQTGAGKTHTMDGLAPLCVQKMFRACEELEARGWSLSLHFSAVEIYLEQIWDLREAGPIRGGGGSGTNTHDVRQSLDWGAVIPGVCEQVTSAEDCWTLWAQALGRRTRATTRSNEASSRSHAVFTLYFRGASSVAGSKEVCGMIHMVDLAGSERPNKSGASGTHFTEGNAINSSLTTLGRVFLARAANAHLPVRDSKLTRFLEPCFTGTGKLMIVLNIRAEAQHVDETFRSLSFANSVKEGRDTTRAEIRRQSVTTRGATSSRVER